MACEVCTPDSSLATESVVAVYKCDVDGCTFVTSVQHMLTRHKLCHQPESKRPRCPVPGCNKSFARLDALQRHVASVHGSGETEPVTFECRRGCGYTSKYRPTRARHEACCTACNCPAPGCGMAFKTAGEFAVHALCVHLVGSTYAEYAECVACASRPVGWIE